MSLVFPFEAGFVDRDDRNQTCHVIHDRADIITAVRFEKTVGWLLDGKTILEAKIGWRSLSEEDKEKIQQNPLWAREIKLAELQQKRHLERVEAGAPMRDGENAPIYVSPAFQWLPRGICQESAFNCFIARETR